MATSRFSMDQKLRIIKMCEDGADSIKSIACLALQAFSHDLE